MFSQLDLEILSQASFRFSLGSQPGEFLPRTEGAPSSVTLSMGLLTGCLTFPICKMGIIIVPSSQGCYEGFDKQVYKELETVPSNLLL